MAAPKNVVELVAEAQERFYTDAVFRARCVLTDRIVEGDLRARFGREASPQERGMARHAAAVALLVAEKQLEVGYQASEFLTAAYDHTQQPLTQEPN